MPAIFETYGYNHGLAARDARPDSVVDFLDRVPPKLRQDS
jgi:hypothetical protein